MDRIASGELVLSDFFTKRRRNLTAQTSKSGGIDAEAIVHAWHAKSRIKSI
jgi:hypothetical protein